MIRYFAPLAAVVALATTAHAQALPELRGRTLPELQGQTLPELTGGTRTTTNTGKTFSRTVTANDGYGNSTTSTIEVPATVAGLGIINSTTYAGFAGYPGYGYGYSYGYPAYPVYPAPPVPTYGYGYPAPYPYGYPQSYYVPSQTTFLPHQNFGWNQPPSITTIPQVITNPPVAPPPYGYPGYGYGYGYGSKTTITKGGINYNRGGLSVSAGSTTVRNRR